MTFGHLTPESQSLETLKLKCAVEGLSRVEKVCAPYLEKYRVELLIHLCEMLDNSSDDDEEEGQDDEGDEIVVDQEGYEIENAAQNNLIGLGYDVQGEQQPMYVVENNNEQMRVLDE